MLNINIYSEAIYITNRQTHRKFFICNDSTSRLLRPELRIDHRDQKGDSSGSANVAGCRLPLSGLSQKLMMFQNSAYIDDVWVLWLGNIHCWDQRLKNKIRRKLEKQCWWILLGAVRPKCFVQVGFHTWAGGKFYFLRYWSRKKLSGNTVFGFG